MAERIEFEFLRRAQQTVGGVTDDRVYPPEVLDCSVKGLGDIR